jgi:hypothetical protein
MSVYSQLLGSALDQTHSGHGLTTGDVLARLLERRNRLGTKMSLYTGSDWAPDAIADQLAYDVALIELSQRLGIEIDLTKFGQPQHERARLEQVLVSRGIRLDEFEKPTEFSEQPPRAWGHR